MQSSVRWRGDVVLNSFYAVFVHANLSGLFLQATLWSAAADSDAVGYAPSQACPPSENLARGRRYRISGNLRVPGVSNGRGGLRRDQGPRLQCKVGAGVQSIADIKQRCCEDVVGN